MRDDEGEEVNAEIGEDVAHPPVGVHGAVDDFGRDAGKQQGSGQHSGFGFLLHLKKQKNMNYQQVHEIKTILNIAA